MKVRKISTTTKFIVAVAVLFLISDIILAFVTYKKSNEMLVNEIKGKAESIASAVAALTDGSIVVSVQPGEEDTEDYLVVSRMLTTFLDSTGVEYVYTIRPASGGGIEYAIDAQIEDASMIGDVFDDDEAAPALAGTVCSSSEPYEDEWGRHISSYAPIYVDGKVVAAVGVDVSMEFVEAQGHALIRIISGALLGRFILFFKKAPNIWSVLEHFLIIKSICAS